jgi:hypothetical protein
MCRAVRHGNNPAPPTGPVDPELNDDMEPCAEFDRYQSARAFAIAFVVESGIALLLIVGNTSNSCGLRLAAAASEVVAGTFCGCSCPRCSVVAVWSTTTRKCLSARFVPAISLWRVFSGHSFLAGIFGVIAFAVFIDFKVRLESASKATYVSYDAGFGLFTGAWIAAFFAAVAALLSKGKKESHGHGHSHSHGHSHESAVEKAVTEVKAAI